MSRTASRCFLSAVSILWLFSGLAFAQTGSIQGRVIGEDGKPLANATIRIERKDIRGSYSVKSNKKGEFFHAGLPAGRQTRYDIALEVKGQVVDTINNVVVPLGNPANVNFDLAARKKEQEVLAKAAESGTLTDAQTRGLSSEQRQALEQAMKERAEALRKNKALSDAFNQGMEAMKVSQFQAAVDAFTKASELDPKQNAVWGQLAEAYSSLAQQKTGAEQEAALAKSIEAFQKALELKPDDAPYHNNYALVLVRAKKVPEAQAELEKAAQLDPANAGKYYYNMGAVMMNTGQLDAAGEVFKKAISMSPNYAPAQFQYGLYLLGKAQIGADGRIQPPPGTREAFEAYLKLDPNGEKAGDAKSILASFDQTIEKTYVNPDSKKGKKKK